ncbi:hypothetical protein FHS96_000371 [Sphingomonas zeicaulis]|uniref:hypothetical protein n=1 Tax=Sphingomonas zeicaulis TaxID=1632740 RepID=UPI003D234634
MANMTTAELVAVRRWVGAYRGDQLDRRELTQRLVVTGLREAEARRFADLVVSTRS